ncbi:MAG: DNA-binding response regulator [Thermoleophilia bacterium]|nr:DNA-binding response regulator [Thermoleophilia bacterium]
MPGPDRSPCRVVVVDDDPGICALFEVACSFDDRFQLVGTARSAGDARTLMGPDARVDAALLDVTLPDCDGIDLLGELREVLPTTRFALFTGWSDDPAVTERAMGAGAVAIFRKDLPMPQLLDGLAELCSSDAAP